MENKNMETICSEELMEVNGGGLIKDVLGAVGIGLGYYGKLIKDGVQSSNGHVQSYSMYGC